MSTFWTTYLPPLVYVDIECPPSAFIGSIAKIKMPVFAIFKIVLVRKADEHRILQEFEQNSDQKSS